MFESLSSNSLFVCHLYEDKSLALCPRDLIFFTNDLQTVNYYSLLELIYFLIKGAQWLSGRVLDSRQKVRASPPSLCCGPWARHIYPSLVLVQPRKTHPFITERLLIGCKESNQTNIRCNQRVQKKVIANVFSIISLEQSQFCSLELFWVYP